jgi:arylsulfatase A-like enzyme
MAQAPFDRQRAKGTVYQGGVNVPLIVKGPDMANASVTGALANSVDLFATMLDLSGACIDSVPDNVTLDTISLAPVLRNPELSVREFAFADAFGPTRTGIRNLQAIRDDQYKIVIDLQLDQTEFFDLANDPYEHDNLLDGDMTADQQSSYDNLKSKLEVLLATR